MQKTKTKTKTKFGTVAHNGETLTLTQNAYIDHRDGRDLYRAAATDAAGNAYEVRWEITGNADADGDDESNACDWRNPSVVAK